MLGAGRPFVLEMVDPKKAYSVKAEHLPEITEAVNKSKDVSVYYGELSKLSIQ